MALQQTENNERLPYLKNRRFLVIILLFVASWLYFFNSVIDIKDWWMENILVIIFCIILFVSQKKFIFSNASLAFIFLFLLLHVYGARMAYTHNEMGEFLRQTLQLSRNPYDRIVHFSFGFLTTYPLQDYLTYKYSLSKKHLIIIVNVIILCQATMFELIEWGVATFTDSATGETYVATQGDPWDAQKDIILASIGCVIFFGVFNAVTRLSFNKTKK
ncbi:MAG: DUF2238 domain-containing protein [Ferruginibacter sp.]